MTGTPLPIHCKWYTMEEKNDLREIDGVNGAFFQPSIDDIGKRICVHAIPASDVMDYHGMPAFQEVGPLILDSNLMEKVSICSLSTPKFPVIIENNGGSSVLAQSKKYLLIINENDLTFEDIIQQNNGNNTSKVAMILYGGGYPICKIMRNSSTNLEIILDEKNSHIQIALESNITRDIFTIILRNKVKAYMEKCKKKEQEKIEAELQKKKEIDLFNEKMARLEKENELLKKANNGYMEQRIILIERTTKAEEKIVELEKELSIKNTQFLPISDENQKLKSENEKLISENSRILSENLEIKEELSFISQDRMILLEKIKQIKEKYFKIYRTLEIYKKIAPTKESLLEFINFRQKSREIIENLQFKLNDLTLSKSHNFSTSPKNLSNFHSEEQEILRSELEKNRKQIIEFQKQNNELKNQCEQIKTDFNCLQRKHESIIMELDKGELLKVQVLEKEKQFLESKLGQELSARARKAENSATEFETLAFSYKKALNEELKKNCELRKEMQFYKESGFYNNKDDEIKMTELKNLANSLAERLGAKEVEISSIKDVNKMLLKTIEELKKGILSKESNNLDSKLT